RTRSNLTGATVKAVPSPRISAARMTKPAPAPSKVDRQPRIAPTATTVITISVISTAEARNEVAKTDVSIMGRPYRDVRTTFRKTQSPWIEIARRVSRTAPPHRGGPAHRARSPGGRRPRRGDPATGTIRRRGAPPRPRHEEHRGRGDPGGHRSARHRRTLRPARGTRHRPAHAARRSGSRWCPGLPGPRSRPVHRRPLSSPCLLLDNGQLTWEGKQQLVAGRERLQAWIGVGSPSGTGGTH